jgi:hypothetical protein
MQVLPGCALGEVVSLLGTMAVVEYKNSSPLSTEESLEHLVE